MKKHIYKPAAVKNRLSLRRVLDALQVKKGLAYTLLAGSLLFATSCDLVLDQEPQTEVKEEIAITDIKGAQAALAGMFNQLQSGDYYGRNIQIMSDISSDQAQSVGTWDFYREMDTYVIDKGNIENGNLWLRAYQAINIANHIIEKVPAIASINQADKDNIVGQAHFIRGLVYFDLAKVYGGVPGVVGTLGVPLVLQPSKVVNESFFPARATLDATYAQAETDILEGLRLMPETQKSGSATISQGVKGSARALLSRLYLFTNKPAEVIKYADEVIVDNKYKLVGSYSSIFANDFTSEAILELDFNNVDQSGIRNWYFPSTSGGRGDVAAHTPFYQEISANPNDERGKMFALNATSNVYYPLKYSRAGNIDNIQIIRLGEIYLNRAEAKALTNDLSGALEDLNTIRVRAGIEAITTLPGKNELLQLIWKERSFELAYEGHSFFDLVRTGQALTKLTNLVRRNGPTISLQNPGRQVFPIPAFDIDANKNLEQNEAYR
ncbi:RagB/SusD family nutrient uptake outer membrane protein [Pontibacter arcticus]|uniref:RagB/SusD family nutrient uptake outer membrane protein n=1 Tax=Pontibacter arcticus TaxID=2080288 RepID=A0A364REG9_9BACT|nr:RagB/SusD family nutrient uptake outer membrane protein [Pontibacter arcticus]RAU82672.1 RagB/SusD family nutrient uptake outer membrane protein [Pontibacter arcticus]